MSQWFFIINPVSGGGRGRRVWKSVQKELNRRGVSHRSFLTGHPGHAEVLARQISMMQDHKLKRLFVIGGDGTMHEVINGLKGTDQIELTFVPAGSYNDFSKGLGIKKSALLQEIKSLHRPLTRKFFAGSINFFHDKAQSLYFINHLSVGFDASVLKATANFPLSRVLRFLRLGFVIYPLAHLHTASGFQPFRFVCTADGQRREFRNVWFVIAANHPYYGGGMKAAPSANPRQNHFDIVIAENLSFFSLYRFLWAMSFGRHIKMDGVTMIKGKEFVFETDGKIPFHADGELIGTTPFRLMPGGTPLKIKT
ncbi:YegS/Rv2252/BmrU family lipid kinase [Bacillus velezensis]|uniref:YegS/Rv2252/BmrU family lipid kinase n=1 Tax=Bacillus velezensis TaxID=492670 RepID=UPI0010A5A0A9|nr:YegS/Rv2252/BmrU family lipid kinase [Bacillus velezensis]MBW7977844.1 YegS/Rv2252/BmrU family lipid kinase [Bacillus velezensis]MCM3106109.1 YegS/Rv2252/BmrU family lipid kinase [Bacillus velezensis]MEC1510483.1 YegS/Rv2252/BmrU family lipid kinase [Bacillus velezensis]MED3333894.1 YegS/Rv2252/BmrU family lipid kinase [Bacillus velezensis]MED3450475.1 YegS/Rv2252/BmrU family lipid kinase [Bacillus velezensis]